MTVQLGPQTRRGKPFPACPPPVRGLSASFTTCSIAGRYAMSMKMINRLFSGLGMGLVAWMSLGLPEAHALGPKDEQDAARRAMLDGRVMPFAMIKRRMEREMGDATYLGSEFNEASNRYRLKYVREGRVMWVDVDGRTGEVTGRAR